MIKTPVKPSRPVLEFATIAKDAAAMHRLLQTYVSPNGKGPEMHYAIQHGQYANPSYNFFVTNKTPDPVSEAIEKEVLQLSRETFSGEQDALNWMSGSLHRIATLSYARGVEDSAMVCEAQKSKLIDRDTNFGMNEMARASLEDAAAAIRDLTHNEKKV